MTTRLFFILASAATLFTSSVNASNSQKTEFKPVTNFVADFNKADNEDFTYLGETTVKVSAESKAVTVNLGNIKNEEITISIEDSFGSQLLSEKVKGSQNFVKKYNVSRLDNGDYKIIVSKKILKSTQPFTVKNGIVFLSEIEKKEKFIPVLSHQNDKLDVNVLLGNYSNITVMIYDNEGRKVFEDKNYVVLDLHKRYDLSKLPSGAYVAEVMAGDEIFYYTLEK